MKKICIFGAGGFAKEVYWLAKQCGYNVDAFIDIMSGENYNGTPVKDDTYFNPSKHYAVVGIGNPQMRKKVVDKIITQNGESAFISLIAPSANVMSPTVIIGIGSVICANCILTCDIELGPFSQLNLATTIGHEVKTGSFFTTAPGVHISGKVNAGDCVYFGTNSSVIEDIFISNEAVIGAGACVAKDIKESGIYVGVPAKKLEKKNG